MLLAVEPPEILARLVPTQDDRTRVLAAARKLESARRMRVTSPGGTDLSLELGAYPLLKEYGFSRRARPLGSLAEWISRDLGHEGSANGRVVLERGRHPAAAEVLYPVPHRIDPGVRVRQERVSGGLDAELLKDYMNSRSRDPEAYAISHVGWGHAGSGALVGHGSLRPRGFHRNGCARLRRQLPLLPGPNTEAGGSRNTPCHMDIPMRRCTIELTGMQLSAMVVSSASDR